MAKHFFCARCSVVNEPGLALPVVICKDLVPEGTSACLEPKGLSLLNLSFTKLLEALQRLSTNKALDSTLPLTCYAKIAAFLCSA